MPPGDPAPPPPPAAHAKLPAPSVCRYCPELPPVITTLATSPRLAVLVTLMLANVKVAVVLTLFGCNLVSDIQKSLILSI